MRSDPILIAGAGIGGLTTALALMQRGFEVEVHEQADALREVGAGLQVSANGNRVLFALGLAEALRRVAVPPTGKEVRLWNTGQAWTLFDLGAESVARYGFPYFMLHRGDLLQVLADAVRARRPDAIRLGSRVEGLDQDGDGVVLRLAGGRTARGQALIGADGVHSRVRHLLHGADAPVFTGCVAWRGLVPMQALPEPLRRPIGVNWIGPGRHVVHYPVRRGELLNFVGIVERDDWQVESWTERGDAGECARDFSGWHPDVQAIIERLDAPFKWALMGRQPLARWSAGRVTLLGDACHPTLPFLAQGAVMAIEDALVLARCLDAHRADVPGALLRYEGLRAERTARIVRGSADNAKRFHADVLSSADEAQAYVDREWHPDKVLARYGWLFEYDATAVDVG